MPENGDTKYLYTGALTYSKIEDLREICDRDSSEFDKVGYITTIAGLLVGSTYVNGLARIATYVGAGLTFKPFFNSYYDDLKDFYEEVKDKIHYGLVAGETLKVKLKQQIQYQVIDDEDMELYFDDLPGVWTLRGLPKEYQWYRKNYRGTYSKISESELKEIVAEGKDLDK